MTNNELSKYDYNEADDFIGIGTAIMAIDGIPTIGSGGKDGIETVDFQEIVSEYNGNELSEFTGLMPAMMDIEWMPTIGGNAKEGIEAIDFQEIAIEYGNTVPYLRFKAKKNKQHRQIKQNWLCV